MKKITIFLIVLYSTISLAFAQAESQIPARLFLKQITESAIKGNPRSQFQLGIIYAKGTGVPQNYPEAMKWFQKAALNGVADAQFNLGLMYARGLGTKQNYQEAAKWFLMAAQKDDVESQYYLGML